MIDFKKLKIAFAGLLIGHIVLIAAFFYALNAFDLLNIKTLAWLLLTLIAIILVYISNKIANYLGRLVTMPYNQSDGEKYGNKQNKRFIEAFYKYSGATIIIALFLAIGWNPIAALQVGHLNPVSDKTVNICVNISYTAFILSIFCFIACHVINLYKKALASLRH